MSPLYKQKIVQIDGQIQHYSACIRELSEARNGCIPINQLPVEIICLVFKEVGRENRRWKSFRYLPWHRNIVHVCRHWRNIGLGLQILWETVYINKNTIDGAIACYLPRAVNSQNLVLGVEGARWHLPLSLLEGSRCRFKLLDVLGSHSSQDFVQVCDRFHITTSIVRLQINGANDISVSPNAPFLGLLMPSKLEELLLGEHIHLPWLRIGSNFAQLRLLSATVPITSRQNCLVFLNALRHMVSLTTLILSQSKEGIIDKVALHDLYQELSSLKQLGPSPASLELSLYGENETRIILASICLQRLKKIRLYGYHLSETSSNLQSCYLLKNLVPADFLNSIRHISFGLSFGQEVGFDVIGSASDALPLTEDDFMLELSECSDSLFIPEQSLQALRILEEALTLTGVLAPNASALRISHLSCNRLHDGTWPAMRVLQSFPRIQILGIEAGMAFREFLPSSGLSYLWKFPSQTVWQVKNSSWRWPIPELVQRRGALAIGTIDTVNMLNGVHPDEYSEEDTDSDPVEYDGFIVADKEEFSGSEHGALHELVSSLVPNLQVIQFITPEYDFGVPKFWAVDLIENCLYFRKAIGLPIAQVLLTYHRAPKWGFKLAKTGSEIMAVEDGELWPWNSERYISGSEHSESELSD